MTYRDRNILVYKWIKDYLKENKKIELLKLKSLVAIDHGASDESITKIIQNLKVANVIDIIKEGEEVFVCLSK